MRYLDGKIRKIGDYCTRNDRVQRQVDAWQGQLSTLVDAYLVWKHGASLQPVTPSVTSAWPLNTLTMTGVFLLTRSVTHANLFQNVA